LVNFRGQAVDAEEALFDDGEVLLAYSVVTKKAAFDLNQTLINLQCDCLVVLCVLKDELLHRLGEAIDIAGRL